MPVRFRSLKLCAQVKESLVHVFKAEMAIGTRLRHVRRQSVGRLQKYSCVGERLAIGRQNYAFNHGIAAIFLHLRTCSRGRRREEQPQASANEHRSKTHCKSDREANPCNGPTDPLYKHAASRRTILPASFAARNAPAKPIAACIRVEHDNWYWFVTRYF